MDTKPFCMLGCGMPRVPIFLKVTNGVIEPLVEVVLLMDNPNILGYGKSARDFLHICRRDTSGVVIARLVGYLNKKACGALLRQIGVNEQENLCLRLYSDGMLK